MGIISGHSYVLYSWCLPRFYKNNISIEVLILNHKNRDSKKKTRSRQYERDMPSSNQDNFSLVSGSSSQDTFDDFYVGPNSQRPSKKSFASKSSSYNPSYHYRGKKPRDKYPGRRSRKKGHQYDVASSTDFSAFTRRRNNNNDDDGQEDSNEDLEM